MSGNHSGLGGMALGGGVDGMPVRRPPPENPEFDITAMIDLVFMMNIYFLFTFIGARASEIDLPMANHCAPLDAEVATVITVINGARFDTVQVFVGDGEKGTAILDPDDQTKAIEEAIRQGVSQNKTAVLIKAESSVRLGQLRRICNGIAAQEVQLHLGVLEKDTEK